MKFAHNNNSVTFVFSTSLNEAAANESFAIRDFIVDVVRCPEKCHTCEHG
jgi:hypothetical protein